MPIASTLPKRRESTASCNHCFQSSWSLAVIMTGRRARCRWFKSENRSEEHTSELQSHLNLVCRLLLEKKKSTAALHSRVSIGFRLVLTNHNGRGTSRRFRRRRGCVGDACSSNSHFIHIQSRDDRRQTG